MLISTFLRKSVPVLAATGKILLVILDIVRVARFGRRR